MCSRCCPTRAASRTWGTSSATRSATPSRISGGATATACSIRWGTTPSAFPRRTTRSRTACIRAIAPAPRSSPSAISFTPGASRSTGRARSPLRARLLPLEPVVLPAACYERGLAYRKKSKVNWCPECATVLANEQVVDGRCWRHEDTIVEQRDLEQWFFRITAYARGLLDDLRQARRLAGERAHHAAQLDRPLRRHRSRLSAVEELGVETIRVFTTRVDTIFGATCVHARAGASARHAPGRRTPRTKTQVARCSRASQESRDSAATSATSKSTGVPPAASPSTPTTASACRSGSPTTCSWSTAPAPSWRCPRTTSATSSSRKFGLPIGARDRAPGGEPRSRLPFVRTTALLVNSRPSSTGCPTARPWSDRRTGCRARRLGKATVTYRLRDWLHLAPALLGHARSRSSIASAAASCRCPTTSSRCCCRTIDDYAPQRPLAAGAPPRTS